MRRSLTAVTCIIFLSLILFCKYPTYAHANQCVMEAFKQTKAAGSDQRTLKALYNTYFGEALAEQSVRRKWPKMDRAARRVQTEHARKVVVSLARTLAKYADAEFTWRSNEVATVNLHGDISQLTVRFADGCLMRDVCVKDIGCLSSYIGDAKRVANK